MFKLLLVEDDNNLREIYEARLQAEGYTIVSAKDGEEALVVAKAEIPDLIISDVMMPKISGFEMLDILRNTDGLKEVKVIMLTALGQSDDQQRADRLGADRYLVKSQVTLEDIVKVAHELLEDSPAAEEPAAATPPVAEPTAAEPAPVEEPKVETPAPEPEAPVAEPVPEPATEPVAEPKAEPEVETFVAGADSTPAPSEPVTETAPAPEPKEEAAEGFVSTAEPEAPTTPQPATESAPAAPADLPTEPVEPSPEVSASDDKLIEEAVNNFAKNTAEAAPAPEPVATDPTEATAPIAAPEPTIIKPQSGNAGGPNDEASATDAPVAKTEILSGGQKVIEPTEAAEPKKDINELLAAEEAKEKSAAPGAITPPATTPEAPTDKPDPNSIAL